MVFWCSASGDAVVAMVFWCSASGDAVVAIAGSGAASTKPQRSVFSPSNMQAKLSMGFEGNCYIFFAFKYEGETLKWVLRAIVIFFNALARHTLHAAAKAQHGSW